MTKKKQSKSEIPTNKGKSKFKLKPGYGPHYIGSKVYKSGDIFECEERQVRGALDKLKRYDKNKNTWIEAKKALKKKSNQSINEAQIEWITPEQHKELQAIPPNIINMIYIKLLDAIKEIDKEGITIAEREILEKELLIKILDDAYKEKITIGARLPDESCIFFAYKKDIYKFIHNPFRKDITTRDLGMVSSKYIPAKLKKIDREYNKYDVKLRKRVNKDGKPIPKFNPPLSVQAESLHEIKTEIIDGKHKYSKIYYDISINNFVIPKREWERYKKEQRKTKNSKQLEALIKSRGKRPGHNKKSEFKAILDDILNDDKNASLGKYVKKVKAEMEGKGLKEKKIDKRTGQEKEGLIYEDSTIRTYIQDHSEYKKIQKRKGKRKKV